MKKRANFEFDSVTGFVEQDALAIAAFASGKNDLGARKLNGKMFIRRRLDRVVAVAAALLMSTAAVGTAEAQTLTILHSFSGGDGQGPSTGLIRDSAGNLYGTTNYGGVDVHGDCQLRCGTLFKLDPSGTLTVLHYFGDGTVAKDGKYPFGGLVLDSAGNLYGTTWGGGSASGGTVFKLDPSGTRRQSLRHNLRWRV